MDERMSKGLPRPEGLSHYYPIIKSVRARRRTVPILSGVPTRRKFSFIREEGKVQKPVYYTSRALRKAEGRYPLIEKLAFALITASRKLRHYFQVHVINVMTNHPLKKAMNKLEAVGWLI